MPSIALNGKEIPFSENGEIWDVTLNLKKRARIYRDFMAKNGVLIMPYNSLDIGEKNWIGEQLGVRDNTLPSDFNDAIEASGTKYDLITCFEVLEHVMNPLQFVRQLKALLSDSGVIYLSTPRIGVSTWYHWKHHFTEYKVPQLVTLFEYAGFRVAKVKVFDPYPFWWHFTGVRPFMRLLFHRNVVFELRKA